MIAEGVLDNDAARSLVVRLVRLQGGFRNRSLHPLKAPDYLIVCFYHTSSPPRRRRKDNRLTQDIARTVNEVEGEKDEEDEQAEEGNKGGRRGKSK